MSETCLLSVDAGGTFFKYALLDAEYTILYEDECPAHSDGDVLIIESAWRTLLQSAQKAAAERGLQISRMAVSTPGPYDFIKGTPLMKHKFAAAYGVSVLPWIKDELGDAPVCFMHDSTSFMLGQMLFGAARGALRPAAVMLGTGFGFSNVKDGRIVVNALQTSFLPVWKFPYKEGTTEDYVSRRAIRARYQKLSRCDESAVPEVKEIADRARAGEQAALETFVQTGADLGQIVRPLLLSLNSDRLILGGQIAKAHALFEQTLLPLLPCPLALAAGGQAAALRGAAAFSVLGVQKTLCIVQNV